MCEVLMTFTDCGSIPPLSLDLLVIFPCWKNVPFIKPDAF